MRETLPALRFGLLNARRALAPVGQIVLCVALASCGTGWVSGGEVAEAAEGNDLLEPNAHGPRSSSLPATSETPSTEVCDGWDNDDDGEVDEGTDGEPCATDDGPGLTVCLLGRTICRQCEPGETRTEDCGCGITRTDRCNDAGRWLQGSCGDCQDTAAPPPTCFGCVPGERKIQRCDTCATEACGATCVGAVWECNDSCDWVQITECEIQQPECERDETIVESCGLCGVRELRCDGCFWNFEGCGDQGVCQPGDSFELPCSGDCRDGLFSRQRCNDRCVWEEPTACEGCVAGGRVDTPHDCVAGADCGVRVTRTECQGETTQVCGRELVLGEESTFEISNECHAVECEPGDTDSVPCTTAAGECGNDTQICSNTCNWVGGSCTARADSCVPGTVEPSTTYSCGDGGTFTSTRTCNANGCGWSSGSAPQCEAGETYPVACTTELGECGTRTVGCTSTCEWADADSAPCIARADSCVPGTVNVVETHSCGGGGTLTETRTCRTNGCGWYSTGVPQCVAGETRPASCTTSDGRCGTASVGCNSSCQWESATSSTCVAHSYSCVPGTVDSEPTSCGPNSCGATVVSERTCLSNGCGWSAPSVSGSCPTCTEGENDSSSCQLPDGRSCGVQSGTCDSTCSWSWSACQPGPTACDTGATRPADCTWTCGLPGRLTEQCTGCGWSEISSCQPLDPDACSPGQSVDLGPCPNCPSQRKERVCGSDCQWTETNCQACG